MVEVRAPRIQTRIRREIAPLAARGPHGEATQGPRQAAGQRGPGRGAGRRRPLPCCSPARSALGIKLDAGTGFPGNPPRRCGLTFGSRPRDVPRWGRRGAEGGLCAASKQETGSLTVASRSRSAPFPGLSSGLVRPASRRPSRVSAARPSPSNLPALRPAEPAARQTAPRPPHPLPPPKLL